MNNLSLRASRLHVNDALSKTTTSPKTSTLNDYAAETENNVLPNEFDEVNFDPKPSANVAAYNELTSVTSTDVKSNELMY